MMGPSTARRTPPAAFVWGRLENRYNPEMPWGTVCDDGFTTNSYQAAKKACQTLGYSGESAIGGSPTAIGWSLAETETDLHPRRRSPAPARGFGDVRLAGTLLLKNDLPLWRAAARLR